MGRPDRRRTPHWSRTRTALLLGTGAFVSVGVFSSDARYMARKALDKVLNGGDEPPFPPASTGSSAGMPSGTSSTGGGTTEFVSLENLAIGGCLLLAGFIAYQVFRPQSEAVHA